MLAPAVMSALQRHPLLNQQSHPTHPLSLSEKQGLVNAPHRSQQVHVHVHAHAHAHVLLTPEWAGQTGRAGLVQVHLGLASAQVGWWALMARVRVALSAPFG